MSRSRRKLVLVFFLALLLATRAGAKPPRLDRHGDPLPPGAAARLGSTRRLRLLSRVDAIALSADGKLVAAASRYLDDRIRVWETATGRLVCEIKSKPADGFYHLLFSPDGRYIASERGSAAVVWDSRSGKEVRRFSGHFEKPDGMYFARNGKGLIVVWQQGNEVCWWDAHRGKLLRRLDLYQGRKPRLLAPGEPEEYRGNVSVSADGRTVAFQLTKQALSAGKAFRKIVTLEKSLYIMDAASGKPRRLLQRKLPPLNWYFWPLCFSPDGKLLAVGRHRYGPLDILDVASGKSVYHRPASLRYPRWPLSLAFSGDSKVFAIRQDVDSIDVRDTRTWKLIRRLPSPLIPKELALSGNGNILAAVTHDVAVSLWDTTTGKERPLLPGHKTVVEQVAFSPDGKSIWSASEEVFCRWDLATATERGRGRAGPRYCLRGGVRLATKDEKSFQLLDLQAGRPVASFRLPGTERGEGRKAGVFFSDDGNIVGIIGVAVPGDFAGYRLSLRETTSGKEVGHHVFDYPPSYLASPDGRLLLWKYPKDALCVWDRQARKEISRIDCAAQETAEDEAPLIACSPDGRKLATAPPGSYARQYHPKRKQARIRFWQLATGKLITTSDCFPGHLPSCGMAFSPDGRMLATGDLSSPVIRLWEVATGKLRAELKGHEGAVHCVAFSPDGRWLASGSEDTTVLIWGLRKTPQAVKQATTKP